MDLPSPQSRFVLTLWMDLAWGALVVVALALVMVDLANVALVAAALPLGLYALVAALIGRFWPAHKDFGWPNRVSLLRAALVCTLLGSTIHLPSSFNWLLVYLPLALTALALDGVDGYVARRTRQQTAFGARFDMELDALFILGLSAAAWTLDKAGPWVLLIGLMRYGFVLAMALWPWLRQPLPERFRRKTVCVWQVATLLIVLLPVIPPVVTTPALALSLALLAWSFALDAVWLRRHRQ